MEDTSINGRISKLGECIQGIQSNIEELSRAPVTPLEVWAQCEKTLENDNVSFENIKNMDIECTYLH